MSRSQIPTFLVSQLARKHVTVSLSGDAGDELFAGYNRYIQVHNQWGTLSRIPEVLRKLMATSLYSLSPNNWNMLLKPLQPVLPASLHLANIGEKLHKAAGVLASQNVDELYLGLVSHWQPDNVILNAYEPETYLNKNSARLKTLDSVQRMMLLDAMTYLPDDILVKVDRASMGASLEARTPFIDHRVVEFAWQLPQHLKSCKFFDKCRKLHRLLPMHLHMKVHKSSHQGILHQNNMNLSEKFYLCRF